MVSGLARRRARTAWAFLAPALLLLVAVAGWPLARTAMLAFTDARLGEPGAWVGLENLAWALRDPVWWISVRNTFVFAVCAVSIELVLGLALALVLNAPLRGRGAMRAAALIPWAIPTVVAAQMWRWMYNDAYGVVNDLGLRLGLIDAPVAWLAGDATAMAAAVVADVWKATPFVALLLLAGLQTIPAQLHEAARVDGAGPVRRFFAVTLPLLKPAIAVAVVFRALDALRVFDLFYVMTGNAEATATMSIYARQQLVDFQDAGYGSAIALLAFATIGLASMALVLLLRPEFVEE